MENRSKTAANEAVFTYRRIHSGADTPDTDSRYSLLLVRGGSATLTGRTERYNLGVGDVVIASEGCSCGIESDDPGFTADAVSFRTFILSERIKSAIKHTAPVIRSGELAEVAKSALDAIAREASATDEYREDAVVGLIYTLIVAVIRNGEHSVAPAEVSAPVAAALAHVSSHLGERLMLGEVAAIAEVSPAYLSRRFKSEVGVGFADYVATARLERAGAMLREHPELSITEVAFSCGFNDSNYFSDKFKHHFGISPLKFKKK